MGERRYVTIGMATVVMLTRLGIVQEWWGGGRGKDRPVVYVYVCSQNHKAEFKRRPKTTVICRDCGEPLEPAKRTES